MGVKTVLAGITFTGADFTKAAAVGCDLADLVSGIELACQEIVVKLQFLVSDVLTPAGDNANVTTLNNEITALN